MDCDCVGVLKKKDGKVYLFTEEVPTTRSIHTQKHDFKKATMKTVIRDKMTLAKHGFATDKQQRTYLTLGSLFWITVMLIGTFRAINFFSCAFSSGLRLSSKITRRYNLSDYDMSS